MGPGLLSSDNTVVFIKKNKSRSNEWIKYLEFWSLFQKKFKEIFKIKIFCEINKVQKFLFKFSINIRLNILLIFINLIEFLKNNKRNLFFFYSSKNLLKNCFSLL